MKNILGLYKTKQWEQVRAEQLEADHYECQRCKHCGIYKDLQGEIKYTRATLVHHHFKVRQFPEHVYKRYVNGVRNLYSLCETCHEIEHKKDRTKAVEKKELNKERW